MRNGLATSKRLKKLNESTMRTKKSASGPTNSTQDTPLVRYTKTEGEYIRGLAGSFTAGVAFTLILLKIMMMVGVI